MIYLYLKGFHLVFIVTWFSGLFYTVRLFIYQTEAASLSSAVSKARITLLRRMTYRLWYVISWPSAILGLAIGLHLLAVSHYWTQTWMLIKLGWVLMLVIYHGICHYLFLKLQQERYPWTALTLRYWNEVATLLLVAIVLVATLKSQLAWLTGLVVWAILAILITGAVRLLRAYRMNKKKPHG